MDSFLTRRKRCTKPFRWMRIASGMATDRPVRLRVDTRSPFSATTITTLRNTLVIPMSVTTTRERILRSTMRIPRYLGVVLSFPLTTLSVSLIQKESVLLIQKEVQSHMQKEIMPPTQKETTLLHSTPATASVAPARAASTHRALCARGRTRARRRSRGA